MDLSMKYLQSPQQFITGEQSMLEKQKMGIINKVERWRRPSKATNVNDSPNRRDRDISPVGKGKMTVD